MPLRPTPTTRTSRRSPGALIGVTAAALRRGLALAEPHAPDHALGGVAVVERAEAGAERGARSRGGLAPDGAATGSRATARPRSRVTRPGGSAMRSK